MADLVVGSLTSANMVDYPFALQAGGGDPALPYSATELRALVDASFDEGVLADADFRVSQRAAGANLSVDIAGGRAAVQGDSVARQGIYLIESSGVVNTGGAGNIVIPGSGSRTHRVIARVRDKVAAGTNYDWTFEVLEDTGSGTPALPASAIPLARIAVTSATSSITDALITDDRTWSEKRGFAFGQINTGGHTLLYGSVTGTEVLTSLTSTAQPLKANHVYRISTQVMVGTNGVYGTDRAMMVIRDTNLAGTARARKMIHPANDTGTYLWAWSIDTFYLPTVNETKEFVLTVARMGGTATWNFYLAGEDGSSYLMVTDLGPKDKVTIV